MLQIAVAPKSGLSTLKSPSIGHSRQQILPLFVSGIRVNSLEIGEQVTLLRISISWKLDISANSSMFVEVRGVPGIGIGLHLLPLFSDMLAVPSI